MDHFWGSLSAISLLSSVGGPFTLVIAVNWNKDTGLRRSLDSPYPEVVALIETTVLICLNLFPILVSSVYLS